MHIFTQKFRNWVSAYFETQEIPKIVNFNGEKLTPQVMMIRSVKSFEEALARKPDEGQYLHHAAKALDIFYDSTDDIFALEQVPDEEKKFRAFCTSMRMSLFKPEVKEVQKEKEIGAEVIEFKRPKKPDSPKPR